MSKHLSPLHFSKAHNLNKSLTIPVSHKTVRSCGLHLIYQSSFLVLCVDGGFDQTNAQISASCSHSIRVLELIYLYKRIQNVFEEISVLMPKIVHFSLFH